MNVEVVNPVVKAAFTVFEMATGSTPSRGKLSVRSTTFTSQRITIIVGVNGQIAGTVLLWHARAYSPTDSFRHDGQRGERA